MTLSDDGATAHSKMAWYWGDSQEQFQALLAEARRWCLDQFGPESDAGYRVWFPLDGTCPVISFYDLNLATAFRVRWC